MVNRLFAYRMAQKLLLALVVVALALPVLAQDATPEATLEASDADVYCTEQGGTVVTRYPAVGTNNPDTISRFAGSVNFCEWWDVEEAGIASLPVEVLYAELPTLAAMTYLNPPTFEGGGNPSANPSYLYCEQIGGAISFGSEVASGSGWVNEADPADVIAACVFADGSMIESFTIFYMSDGTVRGADLTERLRWHAE